MATVSQKYLTDSTGEEFSPITSVDSVYANNLKFRDYISKPEGIVFSAFGNLSEDVYALPNTTVLINNTKFGTPSSSNWTCKRTGWYNIECFSRMVDISYTGTPKDSSIHIRITNSANTQIVALESWMPQYNRITLNANVSYQINSGDKVSILWRGVPITNVTRGVQIIISYYGREVYA